MTILDANILLYAHDEEAPQRERIWAWLKEQFLRREVLGVPWISLWAFVRITTNTRINTSPLSLPQAFGLVQDILAMPGALIVGPGAAHAAILKHAAMSGQTTGSDLTDAALAAIAMELGAKLASTDRDFRRFADLAWVNPLD
ncbi:MAG: TA system VapC family ribonuclease toxin [Acidobacteriota bacterium]